MRPFLRTILYLAWLGQHAALSTNLPDRSSLDVRVDDVYNDHHEHWINRGITSIARRTTPIPTEAEIDRAIATDPNSAYFWTGLVSPYRGRQDSVEPIAGNIARARGGTTLEIALERAGVVMPDFNQRDDASTNIWTYASQQFALRASGNVFVVRGGQTRTNNVWDTEEFPALTQRNPNVRCIFQMNEADSFGDPQLIWPLPGSPGYDDCLRQRTRYMAGMSCEAFDRNGVWPRAHLATPVSNFATHTAAGWWMGGQTSSADANVRTYSIVPYNVRPRPIPRERDDWVNNHPSMDARFLGDNYIRPIELNVGQGWEPFLDICPWALPHDKFENLKLRAMPLGDSITYGFGSSTGDGYRRNLKQIILVPPGWNTGFQKRADANALDFIGSQRAGDFDDTDNEGHSGAIITEIASFAEPTLNQRPNVILLMAGTNDIDRNIDVATAPDRLMALVDHINEVCPDVTILVASIIRNGDANKENVANAFNDAVQQYVFDRASDGMHIVHVEMEDIDAEEMSDGLHPNDAGYEVMASAWWGGLWEAAVNGWIQDPVGPDVGNSHNVYCDHVPNWIPQGTVATGAGLGTNGGDYDCQMATDSDPNTCSCTAPDYPPHIVTKATGGSCSDLNDNSTAVRFADLNGDGRAEYLYMDVNGVLTAFLNLGGPDNGANAAKVSWLPQGVIATGVGAKRHQVHLADLNGDGRAEYIWVHDDGSVDAWLNLGGPDDGPNAAKSSWFPQGTIATGIGKDGKGVRFADLNGDGRAEYLYLEEDGALTAYLNLGGPDNGSNAAKVSWLPQGVVATGPANGVTRDYIFLADINGDGRADYLTVDKTTGAVQAWLNGGGPDNGPNAAKVVWYPQGTIATGVGASPWGIQFGDLNGDGRAEYISIDIITTAANVWLNGC